MANSDYNHHVIPASIGEAVSSRVQHLGHSERELLQVLGLVPYGILVSLINMLLVKMGSHYHDSIGIEGKQKKPSNMRIRQAINTFESIAASSELAMAYSMRSQLNMFNDRTDEAVQWGNKALVLAKQFSSPIVKAHALNNIGTALVMRGDECGEHMLNQSLEIAEQHGLHEDIARVYSNFSDYCIRFKKLEMADTLTMKGIQYDIAHDLDSWTYYLLGLQAQLPQEQGRLVDAQTITAGVQGINNQTLLMKLPALIVLARVSSRLAVADSYSLLCQASKDAQSTNECQYMIPARFALIEHCWLLVIGYLLFAICY